MYRLDGEPCRGAGRDTEAGGVRECQGFMTSLEKLDNLQVPSLTAEVEVYKSGSSWQFLEIFQYLYRLLQYIFKCFF